MLSDSRNTPALRGPVAFLTDFGDIDPFVGQMKGVIAGIAPTANVIDLCHKVPPQRIDIAAMFLDGSREYFPTGTIFVAVVDPGVGTARRSIILNVARQFFVGPDNGIFFPLIRHATWSAVQIENPHLQLSQVSSTFHGRDVFAPAAGHLACGVSLESFGRKINALSPLVVSKAKRDGHTIQGEVSHIDSFGNAWTNITKAMLIEIGALIKREEVSIRVENTLINGLGDSYQTGRMNAPVAIINSVNFLEIAWPDGSASKNLGLKQGTDVQVEIR
jgi:S-adenosyl-L-methionine hydrolase (adenosine-forming)